MAKQRYNLMLKKETHDKAMKLADDDERSFSSLVGSLLKKYIKNEGRKNGR